MANIQSSVSAYWNMVVPGGGSGRLNADGRCALRGSLTGSGSFTVYGPYVRTDLYGDWSQFSGTLSLLGDLRVANTFGYGNAAVSMGSSTFYYISTVPTGGVTLDMGSLSGAVEARLRGAATASNMLTWRVGGLNTDATFAGNIEEQNTSSVTAIHKVGTGIWTLSGTNTYRGPTTVSGGKLVLTGSLSGSNVTVKDTATLENLGQITGNVTIEAGGTLETVGTINGNLTNHGTVRVTGNDLLAVSGTFTNYGVLDLGTWSGTLPANFINHGTIVSAPLPQVTITSPVVEAVMLDSSAAGLRLKAAVSEGASHLWRVVTGPGPVEFDDPAALETTARFSTTGAYELEITAGNPNGEASARCSVLIGGSQTLTFREGEIGYEHIAALIRADNPSWNSGARDQMLVGKTSGGLPLRTVLSFPLHGIPAGVTVTSATLDLWTNTEQGPGTVDELELRPLTGTVVEGTGSSSSDSTNGAGTGMTWNSRTGQAGPEDLWSTPGGDFQTTVLSSIAGFDARLVQQQRSFANTPAFRDAVAAALTENQSLGLMIVSPVTEQGVSNRYARLASDDSAFPELRPRLTVGFEGSPLPVVDPGPAPTASSGESGTLAGTVGQADEVLWEQVSGPGPVLFSNPAQPAGSVTFDRPGDYRLRLNASNAVGHVAAELVVTVAANPAVFTDWQQIHWPGVNDPDITGPQADPDADGLANLVEFALFLQPGKPDRSPGGLEFSGETLGFTYRRARHAQGVVCEVEWSDSLSDGNWSRAGVVESALPPDDDPDTQLIHATVPAGDGGRRFVRVRVSQP